MIRLFTSAFILIFALSTACFSQGKPTRILIIGLDGFSAEGFKSNKHPNIDKLLANGVLSLTTRPVMPSVTLPNWTSHLTGSGPEEHGVTANDWTLTKHPLEMIAKDADGYYPSIFKVLKEQVPTAKTAFYYNWAQLINPFNKKYFDQISFEENDNFSGNYQKAFEFMVTNKANPTLVFLYSVHIDHAGHSFGWLTPEYTNAIEKADIAIGELIEKLKARGLYDSTYFLFITDHGGIQKGHGGVSMSEMQIPWGITGPTIKKQGLADFYNSNKNTSLVIAKLFKLKKLPLSWTGAIPAIF